MKIKHISEVIDNALEYIDDRRKGKSQPLYTSKTKLNNAIDGFYWSRIYTLAGLSASGKSITLEELKRDLIDFNPKEKFDILSFEFEMSAVDQITRNLSGKLSKSMSTIYSANKEFLSEDDFNNVKTASDSLKKYPIYYVDNSGTVSDIRATIDSFIEQRGKEINKERGLIVTIDHILLTKGLWGEGEKQTIDSLMHMCIELKIFYASLGIKIMFILLSQLNRDIEKQERIVNCLFHYPTKNDIFAASSVYYCSDVVLVLHKPAIIEGLGTYYGPPKKGYPKGLPVFTEEGVPMIYWHIIKSRFGVNQILLMVDDFINSRVLEYNPPASQ